MHLTFQDGHDTNGRPYPENLYFDSDTVLAQDTINQLVDSEEDDGEVPDREEYGSSAIAPAPHLPSPLFLDTPTLVPSELSYGNYSEFGDTAETSPSRLPSLERSFQLAPATRPEYSPFNLVGDQQRPSSESGNQLGLVPDDTMLEKSLKLAKAPNPVCRVDVERTQAHCECETDHSFSSMPK